MIQVETLKCKSVRGQRVEIVERKGKGHPDHICDSIMEAISLALCREYIVRTGSIRHHNIDKGLLAAGETTKSFGHGEVVKPMELIIGDRATFRVTGIAVPVLDVAVVAAKRWLKENLRFVDPDNHIRYSSVLAPGSEELGDIFFRPGEHLGANDTSAAVGYFPLSPTEEAVLHLELFLNSMEFKERRPETGEDVKIMGLRRGRDLDVTVAMPLLCHYVNSESEYFALKGNIQKDMGAFLRDRFGGYFRQFHVNYNALDMPGRGAAGTYLSLLGTSAEDADSGQVGRGNRVNGLICLNRPIGTEAAAGKNPVSHVGKIYNILSHKIARDIYENVEGIEEAYIFLLSTIGAPINRPKMASAELVLKRGVRIRDVSAQAEKLIVSAFDEINAFCAELAEGRHPVC